MPSTLFPRAGDPVIGSTSRSRASSSFKNSGLGMALAVANVAINIPTLTTPRLRRPDGSVGRVQDVTAT
eukprot:11443679-Prorocentrum_lima.AAC.1